VFFGKTLHGHNAVRLYLSATTKCPKYMLEDSMLYAMEIIFLIINWKIRLVWKQLNERKSAVAKIATDTILSFQY